MLAENFIFMNFFAGKVTGSDTWQAGTLLVRNSVCNREIYYFLIISCISTITKRIPNSKNMPNRWVVYSFSIRAYFDVTSGNKVDSEKVHEDEIFGRQNVLQFFS